MHSRLLHSFLLALLLLSLIRVQRLSVLLALLDDLQHHLPFLRRHGVPVRVLPRWQTAERYLVRLNLLFPRQPVRQPLLPAQRLHEQLEEAVDDERLVALAQEVEVERRVRVGQA